METVFCPPRRRKKYHRRASWFAAKKRCQTKTKPANGLALRAENINRNWSRICFLARTGTSTLKCKAVFVGTAMLSATRALLSAGRRIKKWQALGAHRTIKAEYRLCAMCLPLCRGLIYICLSEMRKTLCKFPKSLRKKTKYFRSFRQTLR